MMAPTVFDVSHLLGLLPCGPMFDTTATSSIPFSFPNLNFGNSSYTKSLNAEMKTTGDISDRVFFSYLLYTLCKHILCHGGKKVMIELIPLALRFLKGDPFDFASYFLGHVYKVGSECQEKGLMHQSYEGPIWFFQLWLLSYFQEFSTSFPQQVVIHGDRFATPSSDPLSFLKCLHFFSIILEERDAHKFYPFSDISIGPAWLRRIMTTKGDISVSEAWGSFLVSREIHIGVHFKTLNKYHVEVYCPAQLPRQFGLVQAVPLPFVGTSNNPIHKRLKLGQDNTKHSNLVVGNAKRRFMPQEFTINPSTTLKFTQWWHNSMAVCNGTLLAKKFLKHINALSPTAPPPPPPPKK
ncbi:hypothetical protein RHMOL_Rhmol01G0178400 [Rhododendron molle]|uniref:Uncharacterized protein n=1 Tax=Rhododendron molle TaxID=49168 RepID=A0ACC0Q402_RHOML|nr:hypothetical protein RHMOL_Rhmol01G0178400 [Rhododendron molle]